MLTRTLFLFLFYPILFLTGCRTSEKTEADTPADSLYAERHRPQLHFSPKEKWMNDPNGMVYHMDEYHLFYQHYPEGMVWGPMHWGHAVSKDLFHWEHLPIALYPDSLGYIFSGSAVVDRKNTSGLGTGDKPPLVAIYTYHSMEKEKSGEPGFQYQGIAFSTDNGRSWTKYKGNPVLKAEGVRDFRDPKVFWHDASSMWIMALAVKDHIELWGSQNLIQWNKLSEFGHEYGAHGGVWECPDLFPMKVGGTGPEKWIMFVSINPGGPNGGSATQYFTGTFDGVTFKADEAPNVTRWVDWGPDNYAGVTFSNAPDNRRIFLGWMSNWAYADKVPTSPWRSAMTTPRDMELVPVAGKAVLRSVLSEEILNQGGKPVSVSLGVISDSVNLSASADMDMSMAIIQGSLPAKDFGVVFYNDRGQRLEVGYSHAERKFFIDRAAAGDNTFSKQFRPVSYADRVSDNDKISFTIVTDVSSVEAFFDDGTTVMTAIYFPDEPLKKARITTTGELQTDVFTVTPLGSAWKAY